MTKRNTQSEWTKHYAQFNLAPVELRAYFAFALLSTVSLLLIQLNKDLHRVIVPITGWLGAANYMFSLGFTYTLIFQTVPQKSRIRIAVIALLLFYALFSVYDLITNGHPISDNPYVTVSQWRPIWTIVIPMFWIAVPLSNKVTRFCKSTEPING
jgi:hypothetical protein